MKKKLEKQIDAMMEMTLDAITKNKQLEPVLNELFHYAPDDEEYQFLLLSEIANTYLHELLDYNSELHGKISNLYYSIPIGRHHKNNHIP